MALWIDLFCPGENRDPDAFEFLTDEEAPGLLLTIDPLAALAETQTQLHQRLLELTPTDSPDLRAAWEATARSVLEPPPDPTGHGLLSVPAQYLILVTCRDEQQQVELLTRFKGDGLECKALLT